MYGIADVENLGYRSTPIKDRRYSKAIAEYYLANYYDQVKSWIAERKTQTKHEASGQIKRLGSRLRDSNLSDEGLS